MGARMKRIGFSVIAFAAASVLALPVAAQGVAPLSSCRVGGRVETENGALAVLHRCGVNSVAGLGRVGDYWEGEGLLRGKPVVAYLYDEGTLSLQRYPTKQLMAAFGALPRTHGLS